MVHTRSTIRHSMSLPVKILWKERRYISPRKKSRSHYSCTHQTERKMYVSCHFDSFFNCYGHWPPVSVPKRMPCLRMSCWRRLSSRCGASSCGSWAISSTTRRTTSSLPATEVTSPSVNRYNAHSCGMHPCSSTRIVYTPLLQFSNRPHRGVVRK